MAEKYDFKERKYKKHILPAGAAMCRDNLEEYVNCANCGTPVKYGESYTSLTIHNLYGIGYCVCGQCHSVELADASRYPGNEQGVV